MQSAPLFETCSIFEPYHSGTLIHMSFVKLTKDNFILYAMKHYDNPACTGVEEFTEDVNHLKYIRKLLTIYKTDGELRERLIINHLIVFYNVFGIIPATRMLFFKLPADLYPALKTFLVFLNYLPESDPEIMAQVDTVRIPIDINIVRKLREI